MKRMMRYLVLTVVLSGMSLSTGCNRLQAGAVSLISAGVGYLIASGNPTVTTTTTYYIDGQEVDPSEIGL